MKITLDSIVKQIISEAVTPVQFLMKAIKGLGKGSIEAENALMRAIKKEGNLGPKVAVDLNNISDDLLNKSIKSGEFVAYRKLISQKLYSKNKTIIDDIVPKYKGKKRVLELNNAGIPPSFQEDVRNLSNKNRVKPTIPTSTTQPTIPTNPYKTLKPVVIPQEAKDAFIERTAKLGIKIKPKQLDDVMYEMQKSIDIELEKTGKLFNDPTFVETLKGFDRLPIQTQTEIIENCITTIKNTYGDYILGLKVSPKAKLNLRSLHSEAIDAWWLYSKKSGEKLSIGSLLKWYKRSIPTSLGLFLWSIYAEAMRKEDGNWWDSAKFAGNKLIQAPDRFLTSLIPGYNLISSSSSALYQTVVSGVTLGLKKIGWSTKPLPKGESGIFSDPGFPLGNKENDPDGIR